MDFNYILYRIYMVSSSFLTFFISKSMVDYKNLNKDKSASPVDVDVDVDVRCL